MKGDDRVRHCPECQLNVYNFSAMTKSEVDDLVRNRQGRLCARIYQRRDGKVLTQDCPVGFRGRIKKISRIAGAALTAAMSLMPAFAQTGLTFVYCFHLLLKRVGRVRFHGAGRATNQPTGASRA